MSLSFLIPSFLLLLLELSHVAPLDLLHLQLYSVLVSITRDEAHLVSNNCSFVAESLARINQICQKVSHLLSYCICIVENLESQVNVFTGILVDSVCQVLGVPPQDNFFDVLSILFLSQNILNRQHF